MELIDIIKIYLLKDMLFLKKINTNIIMEYQIIQFNSTIKSNNLINGFNIGNIRINGLNVDKTKLFIYKYPPPNFNLVTYF